jgi:hypothetical protein
MDTMTDSTQVTSETQTQPATSATESTATAAAAPGSTSSAAPTETTATTAPAATSATSAAAAPPPVEPEVQYAIKAPEGVQIDPALLPALLPALKAQKLTADQLQGVAEAFIGFQKDAPQRMLAADLAVTMKDPELGGMNYARTQGFVNTALNAFTDPQFRKELQSMGIANRLSLVRVFERIGRAMSADTPVRSQPDAARSESRAERMYGRSTKVTNG